MDALECILNGKVILLQTDTLWGLSCDATNTTAVRRIFTLKRRPEEAAVLLLASDYDMLDEYAVLDENIDYEALTGISLILRHKPDSRLSPLVCKGETICVRIPDSKFMREFVSDFGKPIVSTSANIHSHTSPASLDEIDESIRSGVCTTLANPDYDGTPIPSTIIDLSSGAPKIIRVGKKIDIAKEALF